MLDGLTLYHNLALFNILKIIYVRRQRTWLSEYLQLSERIDTNFLIKEKMHELLGMIS